MASREFLKLMKEARQGDVFSQHRLGDIYLNGEFGTPKQPANALIWLHKAYKGFLAKGLSDKCEEIISSVLLLPFAETLSSPSAEFAWSCFTSASLRDQNLNAMWQMGKTFLETDGSSITELLIVKHFDSFFPGKTIQEQSIQFLEEVAKSDSPHAEEATQLIDANRPTSEKMLLLWQSWKETKDKDALQKAAELGYSPAQLALGLQLAKLDTNQVDDSANSGSASLKKAVQWLSLAAKQGERDAWYNLALIYRRPQFSGYSAQESDRCINQAADLGHPEAQFKRGALLWRKRSSLTKNNLSSSDAANTSPESTMYYPENEEIPELKASYWIWQAAQQGVAEAIEMLPKILVSCPKPELNPWYELSQRALLAISKSSHTRLPADWIPLCHRIIVGNQFALSKAEMLLVDIPKMQHEHCVVVDIREHLAKSNPRLIQIDTLQQRKSLVLASKIFSVDEESENHVRFDEGNLRQRRYRFEKLSEWLSTNVEILQEETASSPN